ncbi:hypothetical protein K7G95_23815 [Escherichia coli]|nr:hypothetical protein K7G95_23815 [Escherichia coli]
MVRECPGNTLLLHHALTLQSKFLRHQLAAKNRMLGDAVEVRKMTGKATDI